MKARFCIKSAWAFEFTLFKDPLYTCIHNRKALDKEYTTYTASANKAVKLVALNGCLKYWTKKAKSQHKKKKIHNMYLQINVVHRFKSFENTIWFNSSNKSQIFVKTILFWQQFWRCTIWTKVATKVAKSGSSFNNITLYFWFWRQSNYQQIPNNTG